MKLALFSVLIFWFNVCLAQKEVKTINRSAGFVVDEFHFYNDSTFVSISGACTNQFVSIGTWRKQQNKYYLSQFNKFEPKLVVSKEIKKDTCDLSFKVDFLDLNGKSFGFDWYFIDRSKDISKIDTTTIPNYEKPYLKEYQVSNYDTITFKSIKTECKDLELVPVEILDAFNCRFTIPIPSNTNYLEIKTNIPKDITRYLLVGNLEFVKSKPFNFEFEKEMFFVE